MTIVQVQKLATGQFDVTLRMTEQEGLDLARLIVQQQELSLSPEPPAQDGESTPATPEEPKS